MRAQSTWPLLALVVCSCGDDVAVGATDGSVADSKEVADMTAAEILPTGPEVAPSNECLVDDSPCDDGDPCSVADRCEGGECKPGPDMCACHSDGDCAELGAAGFCSGVYTCDTSALPYRCRYVAASAVHCDPSKATQCATFGCQPASGECAAVARPDGTVCSDGNNCTVGDVCKAGACVAGKDSQCQCQSTADCAGWEDGDLCNGTLYCSHGMFPYSCLVAPGSAVSCAATQQACQANVCDPATGKCGLAPVDDYTPCDDGDVGTASDVCLAGACTGTNTALCLEHADCAKYEDGDFCNGALYCDKVHKACKVNPASVVHCPGADDTACLANVCQAKTGECLLVPVHEGKPCDDGDSCTLGDFCQSGLCAHSANACACSKPADCAKFDDGDLCNGTWYCDLGTNLCAANPGSAVFCDKLADTACQKAKCDPKTGACGLAAEATGTACSDGDKCTAGDHCVGGACMGGAFICTCADDADCFDKTDGDLCKGPWFCDKSGQLATCKPNPAKIKICPTLNDTACVKNRCAPQTGDCSLGLLTDGVICDDGNPCTASSVCLSGECKGGLSVCACQTHAECEAKQGDGDLCNGTLYCDKSGVKPACKLNPATVITCVQTAQGPCVADACNPATGQCQPKPVGDGKPCQDGDACTVGDTCAVGACKGVEPLNCDDKNACTTDTCDAKLGCVFTVKASLCDDANSCTADYCQPKTGKCTHAAVKNGKGCDGDGSGCTVNDVCQAGVCLTGPLPACGDDPAVCQQRICVSTAANDYACKTASKADGSACKTQTTACAVDSACKAGKCVAGSKERLWTRTLVAKKVENLAVTTLLDNGDGFLVGSRPWSTVVKGKTNVAGWHLARVGADGAVEMSFEVTAAYTTGRPELVRLLHINGAIWAVGSWTIGTNRTRIARVVTQGGSISLQSIHDLPLVGSVNVHARGAAAFADGSLIVVGDGWTGAYHSASVQRATTGGDVVGASLTDLGGAGYDSRLSSVVVDAKDRAWAVGYAWTAPGEYKAVFARLDDKGKVAWSKLLAPSPRSLLEDIIVVPGGLAAIGSRRSVYGQTLSGWLLGFDAEGAVAHERQTGGVVWGTALAHRGEGRLAAVGGEWGMSSLTDIWLASLDKDANVHWDRRVFGAKHDIATVVLALPDGGLLVAGERWGQEGGTEGQRGWVARTDAFGNISCAASGGCVNKTAALCEDGKACTADACEPADGKCTHLPAEGFACQGTGCSEQAQCAKGACVPKGQELLWQLERSGRIKRGVAMTADGGHWVVDNDTTTFVSHHDPFGATKHYFYRSGRPLTAGPVLTVDDSALVVLGETAAPANLEVLRIPTSKDGEGMAAAISVGCAAGTKSCHHVRPLLIPIGDGSVALVATETQSPEETSLGGLFMRRLAYNGGALGTVNVPPPPGALEAVAGALPAAKVDLVAVGQRVAGALTSGLIWRFGAEGKLLWRKAWRAEEAAFDAAIEHPDGGLMVAGRRSVGKGPAGTWLLRVSDAGDTIWSRDLAIVSDMRGRGLVRGPGGEIAALLPETKGFLRSVHLVGLTGLGAIAWSRQFTAAPNLDPEANTLVGDANGYMFFARKDPYHTIQVRTDPWGHVGCLAAGGCFTSQAKVCTDNDKCTTDTCDGAKGCQTGPLSCDDGNACTADSCAQKEGCGHTPTLVGKPCDDGDKCTISDVCQAGGTCSGKNLPCNDDKECTADACDPLLGCAHPNKPDGTPCEVTNACSASASCQVGVCKQSTIGAVFWRHGSDAVAGLKHSFTDIRHVEMTPAGALVSVYSDWPRHQSVALLDKVGGLKKNLVLKYLQFDGYAPLAMPTSDGGYLVMGVPGNSSKGTPQVMRLTPAMKTVWQQPLPMAPKQLKAVGLFELSDDTIASLHVANAGDGPWLSEVRHDRYHANGLKILAASQYFLPPGGRVHLPGECTAQSDDRIAWAGTDSQKYGGSPRGFVQALNPQGKNAWRVTPASGDSGLQFLRAGPAGGWVAAGSRTDGSVWRPWILRLAANGQVTQSLTVPFNQQTVPVGFHAFVDGSYVFASNAKEGFKQLGWLHVVSSAGKVVWSRKVENGPVFSFASRRALHWSGTGFYIHGNTLLNAAGGAPVNYPVFAHLSPWGHRTCGEAGQCYDASGKLFQSCVQQCADKVPDCQPANGCVCK